MRLLKVNITEHVDISDGPIYQRCALEYHPLMELGVAGRRESEIITMGERHDGIFHDFNDDFQWDVR